MAHFERWSESQLREELDSGTTPARKRRDIEIELGWRQFWHAQRHGWECFDLTQCGGSDCND